MIRAFADRRMLALLLSLPVALALLSAAVPAFAPGTARELPCWILPNLRAIPTPAHPDCPLGVRDALRKLEAGDRVVSVASRRMLDDEVVRSVAALSVRVERDGAQLPLRIPIRASGRFERVARLASAAVGAALLLVVPGALLLRSTAPAAIPLASFYSAFCAIAVTLLAGRGVGAGSLAALACMAVLPGTLLHLALCFPRPSRVVCEAPAVLALPYALCGFLLVLGCLAIWRTPALWPAFLYLLLGICGLAWLVLIFSCAFDLRESRSPIERARSRVVLFGSLLLPALLAALQWLRRGGPADELPVLYLWSAAAAMPLPIGLAISRYNLFDLGFDARQGIARVLYLSASALALAGAAWISAFALGERDALPEPSWLLSLGFAGALLLEPLRLRLPRLLESWILPRVQTLREALVALEQRASELCAEREEEEEIHVCVERTLAEAVGASSGSIFVEECGLPRLAHAFGGRPPSRRSLAEASRALLGREPVLHVAASADGPAALERLRRADVALVAAIEEGPQRLGLLLLGPPAAGASYTGIEIDFVRSVARRTGAFLARARASELRRRREREAATGRLASSLAHDTGKDLRWLVLLSTRLAAHSEASARASRDAAMIAELAQELATSLRRVLDGASAPKVATPEPSKLSRLDDVVERAVRRAGRLHGSPCVVDIVDPGAREVRCPEAVDRLVEALLAGALRGGPGNDPVRLFATLDGDHLRILVEDRAPRPDADGGLAAVGEMAQRLGGSIRRESRDATGTRTTLDLPCPAPAAVPGAAGSPA
jgi:hypothetical protein